MKYETAWSEETYTCEDCDEEIVPGQQVFRVRDGSSDHWSCSKECARSVDEDQDDDEVDVLLEQDDEVREAILHLRYCSTDDEVDALLEIYSVEGFGGREDYVRDRASARALAEDRLDWLRGQRDEGHR